MIYDTFSIKKMKLHYGGKLRGSAFKRTSLVLLSCWMIWKERNNRTFNWRVQTIDEVLALVVDEIVSWFGAGFKCLEFVIATLGRVPGRTIESV